MPNRIRHIFPSLLIPLSVLAALAGPAKAQFIIDDTTLACSAVISTMTGTKTVNIPACTQAVVTNFGSYTYITKANCHSCASPTP